MLANFVAMDFNNDRLQNLAFLDPARNSIDAMPASTSAFGQLKLTSLRSTGTIAMAAGDFNGAGFTLLAVLTPAGANIFYGVADGTFSPGTQLAIADPGPPITGLQPGLITLADFNGDGNIAVASAASNLVTIRRRPGKFRRPASMPRPIR